ncbi:sodium:solute symporter [Yersinia ruckeri]|nr:sodium:solute symporter [Yersinia ruckeri]MCK8543790.1 sodium:solute symporter [Yersinia ruckeri]MCK8553369.1 sodium:solute symporter [Yersinia ruckeri]MCW6518882.1 sodium:solute symporter [Yersinia ruckeri]MCW6576967.1 sodium:solute symporter [Yersinia ruckeri]MCW6586355.1 sodium:solute symporter [Yersinia ruckeri]
MKKVFELIMWTLFFSTLGGFGLISGFYVWLGWIIWLREVLA